ncbi:MAG: nicotinate (nicotinamide) nucleotide adenylyltransferase [Candidatus Pelagibacter sp.]|nr:nicotinate (nicotinamide) nucleotide adenylyltransferase [Candidatus Pelagibacter sp.]
MHKLPKKKFKIGILGGTFDPPHIGHLHISKIGIKKLRLTKLIWIITKKNPLKKKPFLSVKTRTILSKKIIRRERKIFVQNLESKIKSINTFDLLKYMKSKNKKSKIYFLIGADNLINFHKWKNWRKIPEFAKLVVFARQNYSTKALNSIALKKFEKKDWLYIPEKKINISSSLIRKFW